MKTWSRGRTLGVGIGLILLTNAVALGGVWWNRAGPPESLLTLSERELGLPWRSLRNKEDSGLALSLRWRVANPDSGAEFVSPFTFNGGTPEWLGAEHLRALGFDVGDLQSDRGRRHFTRQLPRAVVLVLELDGAARQRALATASEDAARHAAAAAVNPDSKEFSNRAKRAQDALAREEDWNSRLFVIDAGLDAASLRQKYPDKARFMLLKGTVRPAIRDGDRGLRQATGYLSRLGIAQIHVPHALLPPLAPLHARAEGEPGGDDRFTASIPVGQRLEPWISELKSRSKSTK